MKKTRLLITIILGLLVLQFNDTYGFTPGSSSDSNEIVFRKHSIGLRIAYLNQKHRGVTVRTGPFNVDAGIGGLGGKIVYNYYPNYNFSFYLSISGSSPEVTVNTFSNYSSTIVTAMMGVKYFILQYPGENFLRPYVTGGMQMLIGTESEVEILNIGTHTESSIGVFAGFGTELLLSSRIKFAAEMGYNLVTDFVEEIGSQKNYSGFEFSFGADFMF
ncbi:MAG: outer membrane beta-barrel protein [Bacteroidetes bacterium]|nr:outer membrane beta-barrel protein [Bacteroidota bacterium]